MSSSKPEAALTAAQVDALARLLIAVTETNQGDRSLPSSK